MKISEIRTYCVYANFRNWCFVKVFTDEGICGVGEATCEFHSAAVMGTLADIKPFFVGQNPENIIDLVYRLERGMYYQNNPVLQSAISGIEMALWDILGKRHGVPVWKLLGGKVRDFIPVYGNGWRRNAKTPAEFAKYAKEAADSGWKALKWDPFDCASQRLSRKELQMAEMQIAAVREAVGEDVQLLIEGHGRFTPSGAIEAARMMAPYKPYYFEEPVISSDIAGLAQVRRYTEIPVAAGERLHSLSAFRDLFVAGGVDIVQPDIIHVGGILKLRKIAALAESFGIAISPHNCNGPIANAATFQADAGIINLDYQEAFLTDAPWRGVISTEKLTLLEGHLIPLSESAGIGVELLEEKMSDYPPQHIQDFLFEPEYYSRENIERKELIRS